MRGRILLFILINVSAGHILAQQKLSAAANAISSSNTSTGKIYYANRNEPPRAIEFNERSVTTSYFLANINHYLSIPAEFNFVETESNTDDLGMRHHLLQQYYKGIPVEGMSYRVHEKNGFITSANGRAVRSVGPDMPFILSEEQAFHLAARYLQTTDTTVRQGRKLIVSKGFTFTPESFLTAFQFDIDVSLAEQWRISIDARSGQVINKVNLVNTCFKEDKPPLPYGTGTGMTNYYGNQTIQIEKFNGGYSRLMGQTEHGGKISTYNFGNVSILSLLWFFEWHQAYEIGSSSDTYNEPYHRTAVSVQWGTEQAFEYYFKRHNRNSFDNNGSTIKSYVHVDQNLNNAFWTHNLLAFGDGSNNNPLVELDVVSHELTHGVTQFEAGLQYLYEPGALNESFSDIMGKAVEFYTFGDTATWQIAKHYQPGGLRDFSNPNLKNQADTYLGNMWYTGYDDNGGVHYNSGVQNFWFYLLCKGGSGVNDLQKSYVINSIGMEAAVNITYRNLTEYLTPISEYLDSRIGSMLAAADLYGKNSVIYQEVDKAWDAVGVIDEPIITGLEVYDVTATTAKIRGNFVPRADNATYHFEYGTTPAFGSSSSVYQYTNKVDGIVTGLQSSTHYYLRLVASNSNGDSYAATEFTTISLAPLVRITEAADVTETTAKLYGQINPNSLFTSFYFEYGVTPALGSTTPTYPLSNATEFLDVSAPTAGLQPRQTYYYRLVAVNSSASSVTESFSFFTAAKPVVSSFTPVTAAVDTEITITGHNFNPTPEKNVVSFGATRITVLSSTPTEIKVKVPAGASFGTISVLDTESALTGKSAQEFVPTFTNEFKKGHIHLAVGTNTADLYHIVAEDMDGDGRPDIVGGHYQGFSILQNVNQGGDITNESFVRDTHNLTDFSDMYIADLDGNGLKDVIGYSEKGLRVVPNFSIPGYIFFGPSVDLPVGYLSNLTFDDFDMDGHIDIAGINQIGGDSSIFTVIRNKNQKGFLAADNFVKTPVKALPYYAYFATTADLNNDGTPDVMIGAYDRNSMAILKNNSHDGVFAFSESVVQNPTSGRFVRYVANDLNKDGWKDVISHSPYENGNMAFWENKGTPGITVAAPIIAVSDEAEGDIKPGDINGDGRVDLIVGTERREFIFLENKNGAGEHLSSSSLTQFGRYGFPLANNGGEVDPDVVVNDLNGDGRPEIIITYSYNFGPHDGYQMEIWQNAPTNCIDPSLTTINASKYSATIVLPPNTTFEQYEIDYSPLGATYWWPVYSTTLTNLAGGATYQVRVRGKCGLSFTEYHYMTFTTDCVDTDSFTITGVGINDVTVAAYDFDLFEVQYSLADQNQWIAVPQYVNQISNLQHGTAYDVRFRGRCLAAAEFKYKKFTTVCPRLSSIIYNEITYNRAVIAGTSNYSGDAILEYSPDNENWTLVDETGVIYPLAPGHAYYIRGRMRCTDANSDFTYAGFVTPCPQVSTLYASTITPFSARINWTDESETGSYIVKYAVAPSGTLTTSETTSTSFLLNGLTPGTNYTVSVAPQCVAIGNFKTTAFSTVCYVPVDLSVNNITYTTAGLSWNDNFSGLPYSIDYSILGSDVWLTKETERTNISLADLRPGTEYEARVHISCTSETAAYVSLRFETGLYNETIFAPNPTDSEITIFPSKDLIGNRFSIYDNAGRALASGELLDYTIDLSGFSAGIFILKIDGENPMKIIKH